jgi:hypothetical protein
MSRHPSPCIRLAPQLQTGRGGLAPDFWVFGSETRFPFSPYDCCEQSAMRPTFVEKAGPQHNYRPKSRPPQRPSSVHGANCHRRVRATVRRGIVQAGERPRYSASPCG